MDKIQEFKEFVKNNPNLVNYVKNDSMTWQKFYELYDLYGEDHEIWNNYKEEKIVGLADIIGWIKNVDLDSLKEGIGNISRVISVLQDIGGKNSTSEYVPRPMYKHFED